MSLEYAVDRLYEMGWEPSEDASRGSDLERLTDGRRYPALFVVQQHFSRAGLKLAIKPNLIFGCYQATWCPTDESADPAHEHDDRHGTVVGACEREAAVYALAQLVQTQSEVQLMAT